MELVDIYPSLCEMAGLKIPEKLQGKSFYPLTKNPQLKWKSAAFSQFLLGHFPAKEIGKMIEWAMPLEQTSIDM